MCYANQITLVRMRGNHRRSSIDYRECRKGAKQFFKEQCREWSSSWDSNRDDHSKTMQRRYCSAAIRSAKCAAKFAQMAGFQFWHCSGPPPNTCTPQHRATLRRSPSPGYTHHLPAHFLPCAKAATNSQQMQKIRSPIRAADFCFGSKALAGVLFVRVVLGLPGRFSPGVADPVRWPCPGFRAWPCAPLAWCSCARSC